MLTLHDIGLKNHTLDTLPRLKELRALSFSRTPEICIERARHVTRYLRDLDDPADAPEVRQAKKVRHYLRERQPLFHDRNLIAGSTTSKPLGAPLFPEFFALYLWPELDTVSDRAQNPQRLTAAEARELNLEIFPYWLDRTVLERTRQRIGDATCLNLFESLVFFIASKAGCISHCVPSYRPMLELGLNGLIGRAAEREAAARARGGAASRGQADFYRAVQIALEGVITYAEHLAAGRLDLGRAMELIGCLWLKIADNVTMVPEASEQMFGGAGTVPAITLGGVDQNGGDAVNDLTYLMLRVTELLRIRDPNVNARYDYQVNSRTYCRRVAEVVLSTRAVPALFNDQTNIRALVGQGEAIEHARDYAVVGCVELASSGRDYPASSSIMLNLAAPMEMALFQGKRPITGDDQVGPVTPDPAGLTSYEQFVQVFTTQLDWLIGQAIELNEHMGAVHQEMMPSPLLSALFEGPLDKGRDLVRGGSVYNSSGATHIGFADVVDSLNAIEQTVFIDRKYTLAQVVAAVRSNFTGPGEESMRLFLKNRAPKYGTEHPVARANARRLVRHLFTVYQAHTNYRGGPYRPAYWTMTNHAGLGGITGALPNGRRSGELFASGITPVSGAAPELTACLNAVAELGGEEVPGCWALNIKYRPEDDAAAMSERFAQVIEAYFRAGGQQVQFNIMDYAMLIDAKKHPENYPELMVRVSGYSAYFKDLNSLMQDELITRAMYDLSDGRMVPCPPLR